VSGLDAVWSGGPASERAKKSSALGVDGVDVHDRSSAAMKIQLLSGNATAPTRAKHSDAGYDLYSAENLVLPKRSWGKVDTDIAVELPAQTYGRVAPRSGLTYSHGIDVGAGVIDCGYRGNVGVILFNHSDSDFVVKKGSRIAQLIVHCILTPEVQIVSTLSSTDRSTDGFGSTGQ
jgi:dUTP pyrophosphatase